MGFVDSLTHTTVPNYLYYLIYNIFLQRITATVNSTETKRLLMDLDISMRTSDCPYTVHFYGAMFREGDVMICMEVMDISLDKFYARAFNNNKPIPEDVLGKVAFAVSFYILKSLL